MFLKMYLCGLTGSIPAFYRNAYDLCCPGGNGNVSKDMFTRLLVKSGLPSHTLSTVSILFSQW